MIISFDLDGTLIPFRPDDFPTENRSLFQKLLAIELVRKDSVKLIKELRIRGNKVGIYTTSYRSTFWIKFQLLTYGIVTDFIINETINRKELSSRGLSCSKFPPAFQIDFHVDDLAGVELEGKKFNYKTILLLKEDLNWSDTILTTCTSTVPLTEADKL